MNDDGIRFDEGLPGRTTLQRWTADNYKQRDPIWRFPRRSRRGGTAGNTAASTEAIQASENSYLSDELDIREEIDSLDVRGSADPEVPNTSATNIDEHDESNADDTGDLSDGMNLDNFDEEWETIMEQCEQTLPLLNTDGTVDSPLTSSSALQPAKVHTMEEWDSKRDRILHLWIEKDIDLFNIATIMVKEGFNATVIEYELHIERWRARKSLKFREIRYISGVIAHCKKEGKQTPIFKLHGNKIPQSKVESIQKRYAGMENGLASLVRLSDGVQEVELDEVNLEQFDTVNTMPDYVYPCHNSFRGCEAMFTNTADAQIHQISECKFDPVWGKAPSHLDSAMAAKGNELKDNELSHGLALPQVAADMKTVSESVQDDTEYRYAIRRYFSLDAKEMSQLGTGPTFPDRAARPPDYNYQRPTQPLTWTQIVASGLFSTVNQKADVEIASREEETGYEPCGCPRSYQYICAYDECNRLFGELSEVGTHQAKDHFAGMRGTYVEPFYKITARRTQCDGTCARPAEACGRDSSVERVINSLDLSTVGLGSVLDPGDSDPSHGAGSEDQLGESPSNSDEPSKDDCEPGSTDNNPNSEIPENEQTKFGGEYAIEQILDRKVDPIDGCNKYLVKWSGLEVESSTWEPEDHFSDPSALENWKKLQAAIPQDSLFNWTGEDTKGTRPTSPSVEDIMQRQESSNPGIAEIHTPVGNGIHSTADARRLPVITPDPQPPEPFFPRLRPSNLPSSKVDEGLSSMTEIEGSADITGADEYGTVPETALAISADIDIQDATSDNEATRLGLPIDHFIRSTIPPISPQDMDQETAVILEGVYRRRDLSVAGTLQVEVKYSTEGDSPYDVSVHLNSGETTDYISFEVPHILAKDMIFTETVEEKLGIPLDLLFYPERSTVEMHFGKVPLRFLLTKRSAKEDVEGRATYFCNAACRNFVSAGKDRSPRYAELAKLLGVDGPTLSGHSGDESVTTHIMKLKYKLKSRRLSPLDFVYFLVRAFGSAKRTSIPNSEPVDFQKGLWFLLKESWHDSDENPDLFLEIAQVMSHEIALVLKLLRHHGCKEHFFFERFGTSPPPDPRTLEDIFKPLRQAGPCFREVPDIQQKFDRASEAAYDKLTAAAPKQSRQYRQFIKQLGTHKEVVDRGFECMNRLLRHEKFNSLPDVYSFLHVAYASSQTEEKTPAQSTPWEFQKGLEAIRRLLSDGIITIDQDDPGGGHELDSGAEDLETCDNLGIEEAGDVPSRQAADEVEFLPRKEDTAKEPNIPEMTEKTLFDEIVKVMWSELNYAVAWIGKRKDWAMFCGQMGDRVVNVDNAISGVTRGDDDGGTAMDESTTTLPVLQVGDGQSSILDVVTTDIEGSQSMQKPGHDPHIEPPRQSPECGDWLDIVMGGAFLIIISFIQGLDAGNHIFSYHPSAKLPLAFLCHSDTRLDSSDQSSPLTEMYLSAADSTLSNLLRTEVITTTVSSRTSHLLTAAVDLVRNGVINTVRCFENFVIGLLLVCCRSFSREETKFFADDVLRGCQSCSQKLQDEFPWRIKQSRDEEYDGEFKYISSRLTEINDAYETTCPRREATAVEVGQVEIISDAMEIDSFEQPTPTQSLHSSPITYVSSCFSDNSLTTPETSATSASISPPSELPQVSSLPLPGFSKAKLPLILPKSILPIQSASEFSGRNTLPTATESLPKCPHCTEVISLTQNLKRHIRTMHPEQEGNKKARIACCVVKDCNYFSRRKDNVDKHMMNVHGVKVMKVKKTNGRTRQRKVK